MSLNRLDFTDVGENLQVRDLDGGVKGCRALAAELGNSDRRLQ